MSAQTRRVAVQTHNSHRIERVASTHAAKPTHAHAHILGLHRDSSRMRVNMRTYAPWRSPSAIRVARFVRTALQSQLTAAHTHKHQRKHTKALGSARLSPFCALARLVERNLKRLHTTSPPSPSSAITITNHMFANVSLCWLQKIATFDGE